MAGVQIDGVIVGVGGIHLRSHTTDGLVVLNNQEITDTDLEKILETAKARHIESDRAIILAQATRYLLDNQTDIREPRGMTGTRLEADVHVITGTQAGHGLDLLQHCLVREKMLAKAFACPHSAPCQLDGEIQRCLKGTRINLTSASLVQRRTVID